MLPRVRPMPLVARPAPFDHPEWIFEILQDGARAVAYVERGGCTLVSPNDRPFHHWPALSEDLAQALGHRQAILDGVVVIADTAGSNLRTLLCQGALPIFHAFDLLWLDDDDLRGWPLLQRKAALKTLVPASAGRLVYVDHVAGNGSEFFEEVRRRDLKGVAGKWTEGGYSTDGETTSWVAIANREYSRKRSEFFEGRPKIAQVREPRLSVSPEKPRRRFSRRTA